MERDKVAFDPTSWTEEETTNSGTLTCTHAGVANRTHLLHFFTVSADQAPATGLTILLKDGATTIGRFYMPANATAPVHINFHRSLRFTPGNDVVITAATVGTANVAITMGGISVIP